MKKFIALFTACSVVFVLYAQEPAPVIEETEEPVIVETPEVPDVPEVPEVSEVPDVPEVPVVPEVVEVAPVEADTYKVLDKVEVIEAPENTKVTLGENEVLIIEENGDTMRVKLGSRGISIVEGEEGTQIQIMEMDDPEPEVAPAAPARQRNKRFKPHFAGLELGLNNYLTPDYQMNLPAAQSFMDLNTGRSWNWNLNILEYGLGLGTDKVGLVTGLGFEWINYVFDHQNSITKDGTGTIVEYIPDDAGNIVKSKLNMTYLTAPLLLEFQIPAGKKRIHISGGLIGGVKIASNTKIKYEISGEKSKEKDKGDFNLSPLRYGVTARIGYRAINLYANYYFTPLFGEGEGPELYPFSIGLCLIPF